MLMCGVYVNGVFYLFMNVLAISTALCQSRVSSICSSLRADSECSCLLVTTLELCLADTASGHFCMLVTCVSISLFNLYVIYGTVCFVGLRLSLLLLVLIAERLFWEMVTLRILSIEIIDTSSTDASYDCAVRHVSEKNW